jgi:hypothetical protein
MVEAMREYYEVSHPVCPGLSCHPSSFHVRPAVSLSRGGPAMGLVAQNDETSGLDRGSRRVREALPITIPR